MVYFFKFGLLKRDFSRLFYKFIDKIIFNFSNHILVDSNSQKKFLISKNIITKKKSTVLLNGSVGGVDIKKFKYNEQNRSIIRKKLNISKIDFIFLYLGQINKDKGIIDLIRLLIKLKNIKHFFY